MNGVSIAQLVIAAALMTCTVLTAVVGAAWALANKLSSVKADVTTQLADLRTDLAVLKKSEESRDEKINRMWDWWMQSLENGWTQHMRSRHNEDHKS